MNIQDIEQFFLRNYKPLNRIEINRKKLISNFKYLNSLWPMVCPVLKSNAYGHGLISVAEILDSQGAPFYCVDSLFEAYELFKAHIKTPILVMGYVSPESIMTKKLPFSFAVYTKSQVMALSKYQPEAKLHLFIDTGMHREGVLPNELPQFIADIRKTRLSIEGVMSHFAESEKPSSPGTKKQERVFFDSVNLIERLGVVPRYIHSANSSAILQSDKFLRVENASRAGLSLYGIDPSGKDRTLQPVLSLRTRVAQVKKVKKGEKVGYNFTYTAKKDMTIAILPLGYNDGIDRKLSNKGFVKIKNTFCPIVGRVSMNITTVDVSMLKSVREEEDVLVFSSRKTDKNSVENSAILAQTIPYDILVHLHPSTKRVIT